MSNLMKPPTITWIGGQMVMTYDSADGDVDTTERPVDLSPEKLAEMRELCRIFQELDQKSQTSDGAGPPVERNGNPPV